MQSELLQASWPLYSIPSYSNLDDAGLYGFAMDASIPDQHDFSSSFTTEESSGISLDSYFATITPDNLVEFPTFTNEKQVMESMTHIMEGLKPISGGANDEDCRWMDESDSEENISSQLTSSEAYVWNPSPPLEQSKSSSTSASKNMNLTLPGTNMEIDSQLVLHHLLRAYGEAMENGRMELTEVIVKRIIEKIDPLGEPIERVAFNLFQTAENQAGYLRQQSTKNFEAAFKAFYQCYPYGRFAHFTANSIIFEAIPNDAEVIHIVDFDMGAGIQWPSMIQAISGKGKALRLTSIKSEDECNSAEWKFEETQQRLYDHARSLGLSLKVEEMTIEELSTERKRMKKKGRGNEWLAFNCMVGLPHMGRRQNRTHGVEFLRVAKELLAYYASGIITFGDGEAEDNLKTCHGYASFFNSHLKHYQTLLQSMESNFPIYLTEARIAMESLFVAPYICSVSWFQQWKDTSEGQATTRRDGRRMSKESLIEAKEIVNEKESSYKVKIEGEKQNEMVLEWKGIPLVRVSSWM